MYHLYTKSKCNAIIWFSCKCTKQLRQYQLFIKHEWRSFDIKNTLCFQNLQYHYIDKLNWLLTFCIKGNIYYTFTCTKSIRNVLCLWLKRCHGRLKIPYSHFLFWNGQMNCDFDN